MGIAERLESHYSWITEPEPRREVLHDLGRVLGVAPQAVAQVGQFFAASSGRGDDEPAEQLARGGAGLVEAAEQLLAGLARRGLGPRNVGADPADVQHVLDVMRRNDLAQLASQPDDGTPLTPQEQARVDEFTEAFGRLEGTRFGLYLDRDELRAVQQVAKDCTPQTRKRIFGTSNGVVIGAMLRTAMAAYQRWQRNRTAAPAGDRAGASSSTPESAGRNHPMGRR